MLMCPLTAEHSTGVRGGAGTTHTPRGPEGALQVGASRTWAEEGTSMNIAVPSLTSPLGLGGLPSGLGFSWHHEMIGKDSMIMACTF